MFRSCLDAIWISKNALQHGNIRFDKNVCPGHRTDRQMVMGIKIGGDGPNHSQVMFKSDSEQNE